MCLDPLKNIGPSLQLATTSRGCRARHAFLHHNALRESLRTTCPSNVATHRARIAASAPAGIPTARPCKLLVCELLPCELLLHASSMRAQSRRQQQHPFGLDCDIHKSRPVCALMRSKLVPVYPLGRYLTGPRAR